MFDQSPVRSNDINKRASAQEIHQQSITVEISLTIISVRFHPNLPGPTCIFHVIYYYHDDVIKWKHFPRYWPRTKVSDSFDVFSDLHPNKWLSKQFWGWWFEMSSRPLWRRCNDQRIYLVFSRLFIFLWSRCIWWIQSRLSVILGCDKLPLFGRLKPVTGALYRYLWVVSGPMVEPSQSRLPWIILGIRAANERRRYNITSSLIGWAYTQNDLWIASTNLVQMVSLRRLRTKLGPQMKTDERYSPRRFFSEDQIKK